MRNVSFPSWIALAFLAVLALPACSKSSAEPVGVAPEPQGGEHREEATAGHEGHEGHEEHGEEKSDLDRSVEELFTAACEHDMPTHQCAECRYEVGVVRVPQRLVDEGLVKTATVSKQAGETAVELTGEVVLDERTLVHLSPLTAGVVVRTLVDLGQPVKAGQPLVVLRSSELAQAQSDFLEADSRTKLAQKTYDRQKSLRESGVNSERELLEAEQESASSRIRRESTRQRLVNLGLTEADIDDLSGKGMRAATGELVLRAPLPGVVLELNASAPGEQVGSGEKAALIGDPTRLWLWANLYERDLPGVQELRRKGANAVSIAVQAYPEDSFAGTIDFVGSVMDEKTRTVKVRISVANSDGRLHPGMFAKVRLTLPTTAAALAVPTAAILTDEGRDFVFINHKDDFFIRRPVVKGGEKDGLTEVKLGLNEGQMVVAEGAFLLKSDVLRSKMGAGCAD
ncbi:MAG: efflux RND transporter periplasmic adaptor subunit [Myxococcales bacterium]|nr:MAG: efflux RND transporter periplasmic adaptor subunit [Myxococcales bacterium]